MTDTEETALPRGSGWDTYWRGMRGNPAHTAGGTREQVLEDFWQELFSEQIPASGCSVLELACGSGAVADIAARTRPRARLFCTDISPSALALARDRLPAASFAASDGRQLPFADRAFDLVVSQFGIEYAGREALPEAARTVAPGGCLALVLHLREGGIFSDYSRNRAAIRALREIRISERAGEAFAAGFDLVEGRGSEAQFNAAEARFKTAVRALEALFEKYDTAVADGLPGQIYRDIAHMYPRLRAYQRQDISRWLEAIGRELDAYEGRLSSMLASALGEAEINDFVADCESRGLQLLRRDHLLLGAAASPSGWILLLRRPGS